MWSIYIGLGEQRNRKVERLSGQLELGGAVFGHPLAKQPSERQQ